ncbi:MAG: MEKHLA domain-containing protein [Gammaproteobacteria bacterium]
MKRFEEPGPENFFLEHHIRIMRESLRHWSAQDLVGPEIGSQEAAKMLYHAPFALLSHGAEADPLFNYVNRSGQQLFEMTWLEMIGMPSRYSAESASREERERLLRQVFERGYIDDHQGVRISKSGRRFFVSNTIVWNLLGADGKYCGQAAKIGRWEFIDEKNT